LPWYAARNARSAERFLREDATRWKAVATDLHIDLDTQ
jgi:hypothetical protein